MRILIIRFSSIGDIVLTTPVIRCLKQQVPDAEIHYITKEQFMPLLESNPYIDKIITIKRSVKEVIAELKAYRYDHIIDLHKNLRTKQMQWLLMRRMHSFNKLNKKKLLLVWFKLNLMPKVHIVDRYMKAVRFLGVKNDSQGLDYYIPPEDEVSMLQLPEVFRNGYIVIVAGAKQFTKQIPAQTIISLCALITMPVVLIGGPQEREKAEAIVGETGRERVFNACGMFNLNQSASLLKQSTLVITADTGMMHIAAALRKEIVSIWGNTMPEFGMYPYLPAGMTDLSHIVEVRGLPCRPCTRLGYNQCPRSHFLCMLGNDPEEIIKFANAAAARKA